MFVEAVQQALPRKPCLLDAWPNVGLEHCSNACIEEVVVLLVGYPAHHHHEMLDDGIEIAESKLAMLNVESLHASFTKAEQEMNELLGAVAEAHKYGDFVIAVLLEFVVNNFGESP